MHKSLFVFALVFTSPAIAEMPEIRCEQPSRPPTTTARIANPGVSVQCGSNSINQTIFPAVPSALGTSAIPALPAKTEGPSPPTISTVWSALISAISGLIGAFAAGFATIVVANRNARAEREIETDKLRADVVASERLRWLQDIRARLAKVYQYIDSQYDFLKRPVPAGRQAEMQEKFDVQSNEIMEQVNMITLMLNPEKGDQAALRDALQGAIMHLRNSFQVKNQGSSQYDDSTHQHLKQVAFDAMTKIGVTTWKQVKTLR